MKAEQRRLDSGVVFLLGILAVAFIVLSVAHAKALTVDVNELKQWADISMIVQGAVLPLSVLILIWQVHRQGKLTRAANAQSLVEISSPFNLALVQDVAMAKLWKYGAAQYAEMGPLEQDRYINMLIWWFLLHENIYHQRQERLIDKAVYNSWQRDLYYFIDKHKIADRWPSLKEFYHEAFARHVDSIIKEQQREREARTPCNTTPAADV
jgi:hypothetical protein